MKTTVLALGAMVALGACADAVAPAGPARLAPLLQPVGDLTTTIVPGEYIAVMDDRTPDVAGASTEATQEGAAIMAKWSDALHGFAFRGGPDALRRVRANRHVRFVEPNLVVRTNATALSWGLDRIDQPAFPLNSSFNAPNSGAGVHIYIIDTGIFLTHTEFTGRLGNGFDAITPGGNANDCHGHGTHVAGTAGGTSYGVARQATLHPVRVIDCTGNGTDAQVISGINWVASHRVAPAVANISLGGSYSAAINQATNALISAGVTTAVAAGNSAVNACSESPASTPAALTVAALNLKGNHAVFSNSGACVDLYAPGVDIRSAWNWSATATTLATGTSMASPHVAGAAALYLSANPGASPATVASALLALTVSGQVGKLPVGTPNRLLQVQAIKGGGSPPPPPPPPPPTNAAPVANFTISCVKTTRTSKCVLDAAASTDDGGTANLTFAWSNTVGRPAKTGSIAVYFISSGEYPDTFDVTLTATDKGGLSHAVIKRIAIP
ncbi:MAG: S8 family peptidase [Gemmatimonadaceae bacterium]|nr:S8 family peptidase [Gemmatimonadaceae bacterium]